MKYYSTLFLLIILNCSIYAQTQKEHLENAEIEFTNSNFSKATQNYLKAFTINESSNYFDYYYAALSAIQSNQDDLAIQWLNKSIELGLGTGNGELDYISKQKEFQPLHNTEYWKKILLKIETKLEEIKQKQKDSKESWLAEIIDNKNVPSTFQLRFLKEDNINFPYLIFLPKNYTNSKNLPLITYLHGGTGQNMFYETFTNPEIINEPIFKSANEIGAIVVYPIAKKDFNWLENEKSVIEINKLISKTIKEFKVDKNNVLIGGMSNGGRATFWFSQIEDSIFTGYFSFSGYPNLDYKVIDFSKITKPFISVNSKNDNVFKINDIKRIYEKERKKATGWKLDIINNGNHGFIYDPSINGQEIITKTIKKLIQ